MERVQGKLFKTNEQPEEFIDLPHKKEPLILETEVRWSLDQLPHKKAQVVLTYKFNY